MNRFRVTVDVYMDAESKRGAEKEVLDSIHGLKRGYKAVPLRVEEFGSFSKDMSLGKGDIVVTLPKGIGKKK